MEIAKVKVDAVTADIVFSRPIPKGLVGGKVGICYTDPMWNGLTITAVFRGAVTKDVLNVSDSVEIPWETVETAGKKLFFGLYGCSADGSLVIPTIWVELGEVQGAADPSEDVTAKYTPELWEQMHNLIGSLAELNTDNQQSVVAALNEVLDKSGVDEKELRATVEDCLKATGTGADVYILKEGEGLSDAPMKADVVIAPEETGDLWADWNAAEGEPGFIANKPFGEETEEIFAETEVEFVQQEALGGMKAAFVQLAYPLVAGRTYDVRFNENVYSCVALGDPNEVFMGNLSMAGMEDTGEPFAVVHQAGSTLIVPMVEATKAVMSITGKVVHTINPAFSPDAVSIDLVSLGLPTVRVGQISEVAYAKEGEYDNLFRTALLKGCIRLRIEVDYTYTNIFINDTEGLHSNITDFTTGQIWSDSHGYEIRVILYDSILYIRAYSDRLYATIRRFALM